MRAKTLPPKHNFSDLDDTRAQRRLKKFRPKEHARQQREASVREHRVFVNKWNRIYYAHTKASPHSGFPKGSTNPSTST